MVSPLAKIYVYTPPADLIQEIALITIIVIAVITTILLLTVKFIDSITGRKEQTIETWEGDGNTAKSNID
jgi:hypothetical protein